MAAATVSSSTNPQLTMSSQPVAPSSPASSTTSSSSSRFGVRSHLASAARLLSSRLSLATSSTTTHTDSTQARARMMPPVSSAAVVVAPPAPPQPARAVSSPAHMLATAAPTADPEDDADPSPSASASTAAPNGSSSSASRPATLSGATDVVVVEHASGKRKATPFHARFGRLKVPRPDGRPIAVVVNGQTLPFMMRLGHDGMAVWWRDARDQLVRRDALIAAPPSMTASTTETPIAAADDSSEGTPPPPPPPVADRGNGHTPHPQPPPPTSRWAKLSAVLAASVRSATSSSSNRADDADSLPPDVLAILSLTTPKAASPTFGSGSGSSRRRGRKHRRKRGDPVTASTDSVDSAPPESMAMTPIRSATAIWVADPDDVVATPEDKDIKDDVFWRPGADVPKTFLPKAIRSGSFSSTNDDYSSDASESGMGMRASEDARLTDTEPSSMPSRPTAAAAAAAAADPMLASFTSTTSTNSSASSTSISGSSVLRPDELAALPLHWGANDIEYITLRDRPRARSRSATREGTTDRPSTPTTQSNVSRIRVIRKRARVWLWPSTTKVVVSDVDGTITRSDALGIILPAMFGYQYAHPGIAKLYSRVAQHGYQFLYVTSRGIAQADATRAYVQSIKQQDADGDEHVGLPDGPVLTSPDGLMAALRREVVLKTPQEFKITTLSQVAALFDEGGDEVPRGSLDRDLAAVTAPPAVSPFVAGFGNRETDMIAYTAVAIPPTHCFCVDNSGSIVVLHQQQESALRQAQQAEGDGAEHPDEFAEILANPIPRSAATRAIFSTDPVGPTGPHGGGGSAPRSMTPTPTPVAPRAVPPTPARAMTAFTVSSVPPGTSRDMPAADTTQLEVVSYVTLSNRVSVLFPRCQDEE
ncbi:Nuclear elongation and deformation protein 1 [Allomyces arbusculus]|nr:Nuclear elongation and deformation protein 1 [Allomyces arbusculus]